MSNAIPTTEDIKVGELKLLLKEHLRVEVGGTYFTDPNEREIRILFDDEVVAKASFDIKSKPEYYG